MLSEFLLHKDSEKFVDCKELFRFLRQSFLDFLSLKDVFKIDPLPLQSHPLLEAGVKLLKLLFSTLSFGSDNGCKSITKNTINVCHVIVKELVKIIDSC